MTPSLTRCVSLSPLLVSGLAAAQPCAPTWTPLAPAGCAGQIEAMLQFDDGSGSALYVAGEFISVDGVDASNIARWDGESWSQVGDGLGGEVRTLAIFDAGDGPRLFAAGDFDLVRGAQSLAVWDGQGWNSVPGSPFSWIATIAASDISGVNELYVSSPITNYITRWDGNTWRPVGDGLVSVVWDMEEFDAGSGPALYAGGFLSALVAFDGDQWSEIGGDFSVNGTILSLQTFDEGSGEALYVAGEFTRVPDFLTALRIARWDGVSWSPVGDGFDASVTSLAVFDDGSGPALYAAGAFTHSGATPVSHIARWNGAAWEPVLAGLDAPATTLGVFTSPHSRTSLIVGGGFTLAGGAPAPSITAIASCACPADLAPPSGSLDFSDVVAFLTAFASSGPAADLAPPQGVFDFSDVVAFLVAFAAGCP